MLLKNAGVKGQKTVFLITDAQIKDEAFLEDVDSVLNTGEVPNLFAVDEKQEIMEVCYNKLLHSYFHSCIPAKNIFLFLLLSPEHTYRCPGWQ